MKLTNFGLSDAAKSILVDNLPLVESESPVACEVLGHRFLSGTIIWLDVISSITSGTAPSLLDYHSRIIAPESQIKLESIMGCRNWIMLQIGRISALYARIACSLQQCESDDRTFKQTVHDISRGIQRRLARGASELEFGPVPAEGSGQSTIVDRIFGYMASLYLHLVTVGFQGMEAVKSIYDQAISILRTQTPVHLLPGFVAPLFIIGSTARPEDEMFFRDNLTSPALSNPSIKHRENILPILESIWEKRRTNPKFTWRDCLELGCDVLLV